MFKRYSSEKGQVLVILTVGIVALLAFAAVAIDGGMYYVDRRYDQNVADDSAFAGAGGAANVLLENGVNYTNFDCASSDPDIANAIANAEAAAIAAAQSRALANNFTILGDLSTQNGVTTNCVVDTSGDYDKKYLEVHVMITSVVQSSLAQMFFGGQLRNTVEAITILEPSEGVGKGLAIVALDHNCDTANDGFIISGNAGVDIQFSGAHSNGCITKNGGVNIDAGEEGKISYLGTYTDNGSSGSVSPAPGLIEEAIEYYDVLPPECSQVPVASPKKVQSGGTITPGRYESIRVANNQFLTLAPGLYCVEGDVTILGGSTTRIGTMESGVFEEDTEDGVTFYLMGGDFNIGGGEAEPNPVVINLRAPKGDSPYAPPAIPGMLIFLAYGNTGNVDLLGSASSSFDGTVFAPDGTIKVGGTTNNISVFGTQLIADDINVIGDADLTIVYNADDLYWGKPYLGLKQ